MEQHLRRNFEGDSCNLEKLCFHRIPRKGSAVSTRHPTLLHPYEYQGDVIPNSTPYPQLPTDSPTRDRISFFLFTSDVFWKRPVLSYQDSYVNFYEEVYEQKWYQKRTTYRVSWGVTQEYLKRLYKQTPLWLVIKSRSLRIPEEQDDRKKRDVEQSAPTHVRHTNYTPMQLGNTANRSKTFLGTDFEKRAKWQGSVEESAAKDFVVRTVRTIEWNEV